MGSCGQIVSRTRGKFNKTYPDLPHMSSKEFKGIQNNFPGYGSKLKASLTLPKPVTSDEENNR
ncbi:hypothetical protein ABEB36_012566 [Hypothenemus hampei]|uniref:Uncharacterized protein n=1 Tax=Hypothenemus hampei TaxID=57062 RepID=A0ABD1ECC0_HYPHA